MFFHLRHPHRVIDLPVAVLSLRACSLCVHTPERLATPVTQWPRTANCRTAPILNASGYRSSRSIRSCGVRVSQPGTRSGRNCRRP